EQRDPRAAIGLVSSSPIAARRYHHSHPRYRRHRCPHQILTLDRLDALKIFSSTGYCPLTSNPDGGRLRPPVLFLNRAAYNCIQMLTHPTSLIRGVSVKLADRFSL